MLINKLPSLFFHLLLPKDYRSNSQIKTIMEQRKPLKAMKRISVLIFVTISPLTSCILLTFPNFVEVHTELVNPA